MGNLDLMEYLGIIVLALGVLIIIFLIVREINCWYWKINERISLMNQQNNLLQMLVDASKTEEQENNIDSQEVVNTDTKKNLNFNNFNR